MASVTAYDREQNYECESLSDALSSNDSCRHAARIAQLYLSRTPVLTDSNYSVDIPKLFNKVFGLVDGAVIIDHGWLNKVENAQDAPKSCQASLRQNLELTFNVKKWSKEQLAAFRVFQLLAATDRGNIFELVFKRENRSCIYYLPACLLPLAVEQLLLGNSPPPLAPQFYESLAFFKDPSLFRTGFLALDLEEFFVFRFLCWFVSAPSAATKTNSYSITGLPAGANSGPTPGQNVSGSGTNDLKKGPVGGAGGVPLRPSQTLNNIVGGPKSTPLSAKTQGTKSNRAAFLSTCNVSDLIYRSPPLEILKSYCEALLPLGTERLSGSSMLFFHGIINLWFLRNTDRGLQPIQPTSLVGGSGMISTTQYFGGNTYSGRPDANPSRGTSSQPSFVPPSRDLLKATVIVLIHISRDSETLKPVYPKLGLGPLLGSYSGVSNSPNQHLMWGTSNYTRALRKPIFEFFSRSIQQTPKSPTATCADFLSTVDVWLSALQPWMSLERWNQSPTSSSPKGIAGIAGAIASDVSAVIRSPTNKGSAKASNSLVQNGGDESSSFISGASEFFHSKRLTGPSRGGRQQKGAKGAFEVGWMWYVIQNYLTYAHVLQIVLARLQDTSLSMDEFRMLVRAFSPVSAFSDPVICILRACEIIVEDEELRQQPRPLLDEIYSAFAWLNPSSSMESPLAGSRKQTYSWTASDMEDVRCIIDCMETNRQLVYHILKAQFNELQWNVNQRFVPSLLDSKVRIRNILEQMRFLQKQKDGKKTDVTSEIEKRAEAAFSWLGRAFTGSHEGIDNTTVGSTTGAAEVVIARLHGIFQVPVGHFAQGNGKSSLSLLGSSVSASSDPPDAMNMLAAPSWLGGKIECVYKRVTALGQVQLSQGVRGCKNSSMSYVGDPLRNPPPICSYEIAFLVRITYALSVWLNQMLGLESPVYDVDCNNPDEVEQRFRINLRFLADARNQVFGLLVFTIMNALFVGAPVYSLVFSLFVILVSNLALEDVAFWTVTISTVVVLVLFQVSFS
mmetsp:Transcript_17598/g.29937  ORF Transcript_17598/g.29937 Transcript_17598/m.29937 type:complete len:1015 (-) Transcript_17598:49-3093(-)